MEGDLQWKTRILGKYNLTIVELGEGDNGTVRHDDKPYSYLAAHSALWHFLEV